MQKLLYKNLLAELADFKGARLQLSCKYENINERKYKRSIKIWQSYRNIENSGTMFTKPYQLRNEKNQSEQVIICFGHCYKKVDVM